MTARDILECQMICLIQQDHIHGPAPCLLTCRTPQGFATHSGLFKELSV